jgi:hypothetical protein
MLHHHNAMLASDGTFAQSNRTDGKASIALDFSPSIESLLLIEKLHIAKHRNGAIFIFELPVHWMRFQLTTTARQNQGEDYQTDQ